MDSEQDKRNLNKSSFWSNANSSKQLMSSIGKLRRLLLA